MNYYLAHKPHNMKSKVTIAFILLLSLLSTRCSEDEGTPEISADFDVSYLPDFNKTIYPSLILGLTEIEKQSGQSMDYFTIDVAPNISTDLRIVIEESKLNFETIITRSDVRGMQQIIPSIKWKYDDLKNLTQPGNVDITFVGYTPDHKEIGRKNLKLNYRAINECVLAAAIDGEPLPLYPMVAAYVNEDSPVIDKFLGEVLTKTDLTAFDGYQSGPNEVENQVAAMFYTLRDKGIKYSSITTTSNSNPNVMSQYIRFADEVLSNTQANCADGTVFFCSALQKIGIHAVMIFVPGHVYLGYYTDEAKTQLRLLETTMVGNIDSDFIDATNHQIDHFNASLNLFNNGDFFDGYFLIDIGDAREVIKPIGR